MIRRFALTSKARQLTAAAAVAAALMPTLTLPAGARQQPATPPPAAATRPNVLFVVFDDLNDWTGPTKGHPQALTPALDSIAARGTNFRSAHTQAPLCNPSRASFLTGLRPTTTGIYALEPSVRTALANYPQLRDHVTLPGYFTAAGLSHHHRRQDLPHPGTGESPARVRDVGAERTRQPAVRSVWPAGIRAARSSTGALPRSRRGP